MAAAKKHTRTYHAHFKQSVELMVSVLFLVRVLWKIKNK